MKLDIQLFAISKSTTFSESNISVQNNTSSLTITIYFSANNSTTWFTSETLYCTCNGVTKSAQVAHSKGGSVTKSFTFNNIAHNNDGTKTVSWSWSCATGTSVLGTVSANGTKTLTKIARASAISFSDNPAELNSALTISLTKYIENSTDTLTFTIGNLAGTIGTTTQNQYIWTPPLSLASQITDATSRVCTITCTSYDNGTLIGKSTATLTLVVPSSVVPSVSIGTPEEADTTMISKNWGVFVQNKSKVSIPITATGIYDSTIQSIVTTINGLNFTGTPVATPVLVTAGTNTISTTTTDSRGRTATDTDTYSVVAYSNPNIEIAQVQRCLSDGTISDNGTYLLIDFKSTISSVNNNNTALHRIGYKKTTDANYTYETLSSNYAVNIQNQVSTFTISTDYSYDIIFESTDAFMTTNINRLIDTGFDLLNFNASGKSMAIGKVSSAGANDELLEVDLETTFSKAITTEDITADDITSTSITSTSGSFTNLSKNNIPILMPYELYDNNTTFTDLDILLSDSSANYEYLEIFYVFTIGAYSYYNSLRVSEPNGKMANLIGAYDNGTRLYQEVAQYSISGTNITRIVATRWRFGVGEDSTRTNTTSSDASLWITKVVGYK